LENRIGAAVREKRKAFGYSIEELAEKAGKTPSFIGQIERGVTKPSLDTLTALTHLLAIDANVYFHDNYDRHIESREFYLMLEQLPQELRQLSLDIIRQIFKFRRQGV